MKRNRFGYEQRPFVCFIVPATIGLRDLLSGVVKVVREQPLFSFSNRRNAEILMGTKNKVAEKSFHGFEIH